jgi:hypothetical protein
MLVELVARRVDRPERRGIVVRRLLRRVVVGWVVFRRLVRRVFVVRFVVRLDLGFVRLLRARHRLCCGDHVLRLLRAGWRHAGRRCRVRRGHGKRGDVGVGANVPVGGSHGVLRHAGHVAMFLRRGGRRFGAVSLHVERRDVADDQPVMVALVRDFFAFLVARKKIWLVPLVALLLALGALVALGQSSVVAPFIYTLF